MWWENRNSKLFTGFERALLHNIYSIDDKNRDWGKFGDWRQKELERSSYLAI